MKLYATLISGSYQYSYTEPIDRNLPFWVVKEDISPQETLVEIMSASTIDKSKVFAEYIFSPPFVGRDLSGNNYHLEFTGSNVSASINAFLPIVGATGVTQSYVNIAASNNRAYQIPAAIHNAFMENFVSGSFAAEVILLNRDINMGGTWDFILGEYGPDGTAHSRFLIWNRADGGGRFQFLRKFSDNTTNELFTPRPEYNKFIHIIYNCKVITGSNTIVTTSVYYNGNLMVTGTVSKPSGTFFSGSARARFYIGKNNTATDAFDGNIAKIKFFNTHLEEEEIKTYYSSSFFRLTR